MRRVGLQVSAHCLDLSVLNQKVCITQNTLRPARPNRCVSHQHRLRICQHPTPVQWRARHAFRQFLFPGQFLVLVGFLFLLLFLARLGCLPGLGFLFIFARSFVLLLFLRNPIKSPVNPDGLHLRLLVKISLSVHDRQVRHFARLNCPQRFFQPAKLRRNRRRRRQRVIFRESPRPIASRRFAYAKILFVAQPVSG